MADEIKPSEIGRSIDKKFETLSVVQSSQYNADETHADDPGATCSQYWEGSGVLKKSPREARAT